jgi:hypothetical protein
MDTVDFEAIPLPTEAPPIGELQIFDSLDLPTIVRKDRSTRFPKQDLTASATISATPQLRDLQKELISFVPKALQKGTRKETVDKNYEQFMKKISSMENESIDD